MIENKKIMAKNITNQMAKNNVSAADVCRALNIKQNTFSDWVNAKTYPRIDKIEAMANYFGINKALLVEDVIPLDYCTNEELAVLKAYRALSSDKKDMIAGALGIQRQDTGLQSLNRDEYKENAV